MFDVSIGLDGRVWLTGENETIWLSCDGVTFTQQVAEGFRSIAGARHGAAWAVGWNGSLWEFR